MQHLVTGPAECAGAVHYSKTSATHAGDNPAFELTKWYADCTGEDGDALIVYHAELRWRAFRMHYANLMMRRAGEPAGSSFSLRRQSPPGVLGDRIEWQSSEWNAHGVWRQPDHDLREILFDSAAGAVLWHCVAPRSQAAVSIGSGRPFRGWGYVECLRLTLAPWRLPIRRLRWGRFLNAADALVWIDWGGEYNRQVLYHNGAAVPAGTIGDREIVLGDSLGVLSLDRREVLREGTLGATALSALPCRQRLLLARTLGIRECKWLSHAVLRRPGHTDSTGMAIHEVVEWP